MGERDNKGTNGERRGGLAGKHERLPSPFHIKYQGHQ